MKTWDHPIDCCIDNGRRLLEDAQCLLDYERHPSAKALAILAQEEFAKAYILRLVQDQIIPWCPEVQRACRDHSCKHLVGLVMDYLHIPLDEFLEGIGLEHPPAECTIPRHVADALNIFCHEKLGRWKSKNWFWADDFKYDQTSQKIADGSLDRIKQSCLYVGVGEFSVTSIPSCTKSDVENEISFGFKLCEVARATIGISLDKRQHIYPLVKVMLEE